MFPSSPPTTLTMLLDRLLEILSLGIPALFAVVFLFIVWKVIDAWVINAGDPKKVEEGKNYVVVGVIAFVVMVSAWGVVYVVRSSLFGL